MNTPRTHILHALEELENEDFIRFQWQLALKTVDGVKLIPKFRLEKNIREQTVDLMVGAYTEEGAVAVAVETLQLIRQHDAANMLAKYPTPAQKEEQKEQKLK